MDTVTVDKVVRRIDDLADAPTDDEPMDWFDRNEAADFLRQLSKNKKALTLLMPQSRKSPKQPIYRRTLRQLDYVIRRELLDDAKKAACKVAMDWYGENGSYRRHAIAGS